MIRPYYCDVPAARHLSTSRPSCLFVRGGLVRGILGTCAPRCWQHSPEIFLPAESRFHNVQTTQSMPKAASSRFLSPARFLPHKLKLRQRPHTPAEMKPDLALPNPQSAKRPARSACSRANGCCPTSPMTVLPSRTWHFR